MQSKKVLAIASGGGHWKQLMLIKEALQNCDVKYVTTIDGLAQHEGIQSFELVKDANKTTKFALVIAFFQLLSIVMTFKPDVVISTGAAPGVMGIFWGRVFGARTLWIDSIANAEKLSLGGKIAKKISNETVTQWKHLGNNQVCFKGAVF